jgi:hypothetical protein
LNVPTMRLKVPGRAGLSGKAGGESRWGPGTRRRPEYEVPW